MSRVLVVAAHPDDEAIGCGGTIARHARAGDEVGCLFFTDGVGSRDRTADAVPQMRSAAAVKASRILDVSLVAAFDFPDNQLDRLPLLELVKPLEREIARFQPDTIYTHFSGDLNVDHRLVAQAVFTAARPQPDSGIERIHAFEVASATGWSGSSPAYSFVPNRFVDITRYWPVKRRALQAYGDEMHPYPHARSVEALESLARWRGASVGIELAEAFVVEREIA